MKYIFLFLVLAIAVHAQPWHPDTIWTRAGAGEQSRYGASVFSLGDQNNDGYMDWGVFALGRGNLGQPSEPMAEFFHGGNPPSEVPYMVIRANPDSEFYLWAVNTVGDLNGDGFIDWMVAESPTEESITMKFYLGGYSQPTQPFLVLSYSLPPGILFESVDDFNGDGFDDLGIYRNGILHLLYGGVQMDSLSDWILRHTPDRPYLAYIKTHGDLNGDGYSDFISNDHDRGETYVFYGSPNPDTIPRITWDNFDPLSPTIVNDLNGDGKDELVHYGGGCLYVHFGRDTLSRIPDYTLTIPQVLDQVEIHGVGDVNHDTYGDMMLTASECVGCESGVAVLYLGHPWLNPDPAWEIYGGFQEGELIGMRTSAGLDDVNGDSVGDFALGAWNGMSYGWRGRAMIFAGDSTLRVDADDPVIFHPSSFSVSVYPNPFNSTATIEMELSASNRDVDLTIYDITVRRVFADQLQPVSRRVSYRYNADHLSSGIYFLHVQTNQTQTTQKLVLIK